MNISEFIKEDLVMPALRGKSKKQVLEEMVNHIAAREPGVVPGDVLRILMEREKLGSTGIGNGVAIPHGKLEGIKKLILAFGKSPEGVDFDAMDGKPVQLFFLLLAPENSAGVHLKVLARLSRLLKDNSFRQKLINISEREKLYTIIIEEDENISELPCL